MYKHAMVGVAALMAVGACGCDYRPGVRVVDERRTEVDVGRDERIFPTDRPAPTAHPLTRPSKPIFRQD